MKKQTVCVTLFLVMVLFLLAYYFHREQESTEQVERNIQIETEKEKEKDKQLGNRVGGICELVIPAYSEVKVEKQGYITVACGWAEKGIYEARKAEEERRKAEEYQLLCQIVMAEAGGEGRKGVELVAGVIVNRTQCPSFPDSITEVIQQEGQFESYGKGTYQNKTVTEECKEAVNRVLSGENKTQGALYFESKQNTNQWHKENRTYLFAYGNHIFYK